MHSASHPNRLPAAILPGIYALAGGLVTLAGWLFHAPRLTDWIGSGIAMFPNAGISAACGGAAMIIGGMGGVRLAWIQRALGILVCLIGTLTLSQHLLGIDLGIDRLLIDPSWGQRAAASPGRMGPPASLSFAIIGLAVALAAGDARARRVVPALGIVVSSIALFSIIAYMVRADPLFSTARFTGIALQTATFTLALGVGAAALTPEYEPVRTLIERSAAGMPARGALPFITMLPIALAWLRTLGQDAGLYDAGMGRALLVLPLIGIQCGLLWWCVGAVRSHEQAIQERAREIDDLNRRLQGAMAETHHRVKNNLQVVAAMIDMHAMRDQAAVTPEEIGKLGQHIRSLALIHDLLTHQARSGQGAEYIHTRDVVDRLAPLLQSLVGDRRITFEIEDLPLALRQGTSLAVLVNELVSNSVKHGRGDIDVKLESVNNHARLRICDRGPGFAEGFNPVRGAKMGLQLVESISRFDLQGSLVCENRPEGGARVTIDFPRAALGAEKDADRPS